MKNISEKEIAKKIYDSIFKYLENKNLSIREWANTIEIPYTTVFTWLEKLKQGKCISVKNIIFLEKKIGKELIFF